MLFIGKVDRKCKVARSFELGLKGDRSAGAACVCLVRRCKENKESLDGLGERLLQLYAPRDMAAGGEEGHASIPTLSTPLTRQGGFGYTSFTFLKVHFYILMIN